ncbi:MAG: hypothetical protein COU33_03535, partial [Candidatus Magasanikbacteria bacterium CG10_big_fil_rev_8_21_14_0_10_43_6]
MSETVERKGAGKLPPETPKSIETRAGEALTQLLALRERANQDQKATLQVLQDTLERAFTAYEAYTPDEDVLSSVEPEEVADLNAAIEHTEREMATIEATLLLDSRETPAPTPPPAAEKTTPSEQKDKIPTQLQERMDAIDATVSRLGIAQTTIPEAITTETESLRKRLGNVGTKKEGTGTRRTKYRENIKKRQGALQEKLTALLPSVEIDATDSPRDIAIYQALETAGMSHADITKHRQMVSEAVATYIKRNFGTSEEAAITMIARAAKEHMEEGLNADALVDAVMKKKGPEAVIKTASTDVSALSSARGAAEQKITTTPQPREATPLPKGYDAAKRALEKANFGGLLSSGEWPTLVAKAAEKGAKLQDAVATAIAVSNDGTYANIPTVDELLKLIAEKKQKQGGGWIKRKMPRLAKMFAGIALVMGLKSDVNERPQGAAGSTESNKAGVTAQQDVERGTSVVDEQEFSQIIVREATDQDIADEASYTLNRRLRDEEAARNAKEKADRDAARSIQVTRDIEGRQAQKDEQAAQERYIPTAAAAGINMPEGTSDVVVPEPIDTDQIQSHKEISSEAPAPVISKEVISQPPAADAPQVEEAPLKASFADPMSYGEETVAQKAQINNREVAQPAEEVVPEPVATPREVEATYPTIETATTIDGTYEIKKGQGVLHAFSNLLGNGGKERVLTALMEINKETDQVKGELLFQSWEDEQLEKNGVNPKTLQYKKGIRIKPGDSYALAFTPEGPVIALADKVRSEEREPGEVTRTHIVKKGDTPIGVIDGFLKDPQVLQAVIDWERSHNHATDTDEKIAHAWRNKQVKDNGFSLRSTKNNPPFTPGMQVELRTDTEGKLGVFVKIEDKKVEKETTPEAPKEITNIQFAGQTYRKGEKVIYKTAKGGWKEYTIEIQTKTDEDGNTIPAVQDGYIQLKGEKTIFAIGPERQESLVRGTLLDGMMVEDLGADAFKLHVE